MTTRDDIAAKARGAINTPWRHQGRLVPLGVDCAGLVLWTARELGLVDPRFEPPPYPETAKWSEFLQYFEGSNALYAIDKRQVRKGDVLIFRQHIYPCHCGILTTENEGYPLFVHSYRVRMKVVEEGYVDPWLLLTRAAFRFKGID